MAAMSRHPDETRRKILEAALWEMYRHGFKGASIDRLLDGTGLTKGALYHHFPNKLQLGYAVVDEVIGPWIHERWIEPLEQGDNPIDALALGLRRALEHSPEEMIHGGCPLNNLAQEMAGLDEGFRVRVEAVLETWRSAIASHLARGQQQGHVRTDLDPAATAAFLVSSVEGIAGTAKSSKDIQFARQIAAVLESFIESLRPLSRSALTAS